MSESVPHAQPSHVRAALCMTGALSNQPNKIQCCFFFLEKLQLTIISNFIFCCNTQRKYESRNFLHQQHVLLHRRRHARLLHLVVRCLNKPLEFLPSWSQFRCLLRRLVGRLLPLLCRCLVPLVSSCCCSQGVCCLAWFWCPPSAIVVVTSFWLLWNFNGNN